MMPFRNSGRRLREETEGEHEPAGNGMHISCPVIPSPDLVVRSASRLSEDDIKRARNDYEDVNLRNDVY